MTEVDPGDLVTTNEAAEILRQQPSTLIAWRSLKRGPRFLKVGRTAMYLRADLRTWLADQIVEPAGAAR
jgi:Helix-turn-helix domain